MCSLVPVFCELLSCLVGLLPFTLATVPCSVVKWPLSALASGDSCSDFSCSKDCKTCPYRSLHGHPCVPCSDELVIGVY